MTPEQMFNVEMAKLWISGIQLVITVIASVAIPAILFFFGNRFTKTRENEVKLREDRLDIYYGILEPFFDLFTTSGDKKDEDRAAKAGKKMLTDKYQQLAFKLSIIGSDEVVRAFNNLMQRVYNPADEEQQGSFLIRSTADLFLEIRRSLGVEKTEVHSVELLEWKITDVREQKRMGKYPENLWK